MRGGSWLVSEKIRERQHPGAVSADRDNTLNEYQARWLKTLDGEIKPRTHASYSQQLRLQG
jgi:hypothetical protein